MTESTLKGRRVLVVEDEYLLASCLTDALLVIGAIVIGPVATIEDAVTIISAETVIDGAILDLNLHGRMSFDLADRLAARGIAIVFTTGHDRSILPDHLKKVALCQKPFSIDTVMLAIAHEIGRHDGQNSNGLPHPER